MYKRGMTWLKYCGGETKINYKSTFGRLLWAIGTTVIRAKTVVEKAVQCSNAQIAEL